MCIRDRVTLGQYKGIEVEKADAEVKEEDVEAELKRVQNQNARLISVTDRPVAKDDQVVIDFDGSVDGKAFDGGKAEDYPLTIGSHAFIDTFEDQLIGKNIGEECEVNVTFPQEYHAKELAGKPVSYTHLALIRLYELVQESKLRPALIIAMSVGFVNVVQSKELILSLKKTPFIVARGRKGGSNIAAAVCNALIYQA